MGKTTPHNVYTGNDAVDAIIATLERRLKAYCVKNKLPKDSFQRGMFWIHELFIKEDNPSPERVKEVYQKAQETASKKPGALVPFPGNMTPHGFYRIVNGVDFPNADKVVPWLEEYFGIPPNDAAILCSKLHKHGRMPFLDTPEDVVRFAIRRQWAKLTESGRQVAEQHGISEGDPREVYSTLEIAVIEYLKEYAKTGKGITAKELTERLSSERNVCRDEYTVKRALISLGRKDVVANRRGFGYYLTAHPPKTAL